MSQMRLRLVLVVCSWSKKNHAEMEKKITTPTLPPAPMMSWKKIFFPSKWHVFYAVSVMEDEMICKNHEHGNYTQKLDT